MQSVHPALAPLEFLLGIWRGSGRGCYPTIEPFEYTEQATYVPGPDKPFISYRQTTRRLGGDGAPLHAETGYVRPAGRGRAELVIVQPTGLVEVHAGAVRGNRVEFRTSLVGRSATAVEVTQVRRIVEVTDDIMTYRLDMEAVGRPIQTHLVAELARASDTRGG